MKKIFNIICASFLLMFIITGCSNPSKETNHDIEVSPAHHLIINTPEDAINELKKGNQRFLENKMINTNYQNQIQETKDDQHPHSFILSCMDSRVPPELIFDQGIGNIFVARVAGNIQNEDILGSMEYAAQIKGTKLILVMGHTNCGGVKGAIDNVQLGNLTQLVDKIKPAIKGDTTNKKQMLDETSKENIKMTINNILKGSPVIQKLVNEKKVIIKGAYYDLATGKVTFFD